MNSTIQRKLQHSFAKYGNRVAITYKNKKTTYDELNHMAYAIQELLRKRKISEGTHIGILLDDKVKLIAAIIGILRMRCIFIPMDVSYPKQRLKWMAQSTDMEILITQAQQSSQAEDIFGWNENGEILYFDDISSVGEDVLYSSDNSSPTDPIYIFFTSGSMDKPKAIVGKNESLVHFVEWESKMLKGEQNINVSQLTSSGFDAILRDIFVPLCMGATICIPKSKADILDPIRLSRWLKEQKVNLIHCTPSLFSSINHEKLTADDYPDLKFIFMAGERINPNDLKRWYEIMGERVLLVNLYGSTETTMVKTFYQLQKEDIALERIPIGKAMDHVELCILDEDMNPCKEGEEGEIYVGSRYLTLGYYHNDSLNKEKFKLLETKKGKLNFYKTGDMAKTLPNGDIVFLGRIDRQIKIRGNRVEQEEIENCLLKYSGVEQCVVDVRNHLGRPLNEKVRYCRRCGLPSSYPSVVIEDDEVCNVCKEFDDFKDSVTNYFKTMDHLKDVLLRTNGEINKSEYDCLLLYSGGKDSTYVLYQLIEMGIRVLACTFDNGFISEAATQNIQNIVNELGVDHVTLTKAEMPEIFRDGIEEDFSVCDGCFKVLRFMSTKLAYEKGIKSIVTGLSRGQIFDVRLYDILKQGVRDVKDIEDKIFEQRLLYYSKHDYVSKAFEKDGGMTENILKEVELVDFFRYCDVSKKEILRYLKDRSALWNNPTDTGACSSNCIINDVGIFLQRKYRKYDNYTFPSSWEVRLGHISLEDSQKELKGEVAYSKVMKILDSIGYRGEHEKKYTAEYLIAYYTSAQEIPHELLKEHLLKYLPEYMIPSYFVHLNSMPLLSNGKVDYHSLPLQISEKKKRYKAPSDEVEIKLSEIWGEILGTNEISMDDNFLDIGAHSLNIMTMISLVYERFGVELSLEEVFKNGTVKEIAKFIRESSTSQFAEIPKAEEKEYYLLSSAQRRVFTNEQINEVGIGYHLTTAFVIKGKTDEKRLETAIQELIKRHESLRTSIHIVNGEPVQKIAEKLSFQLPVILLHNKALEEVIQEHIVPFDLSIAPLFRAFLIRVTTEEHILVLDVHHIIADGKSILILVRDLAAIYGEMALLPLKIQYKDFAEWQELLQKDEMLRQETYWLNAFADFKKGKEIPLDFPRTQSRDYRGDSITWKIDKSLCNQLYKTAAKNRVTLFMLLLTGFHILYSKVAACEDVTVGVPMEGRSHPALKDMVGMFVNTLTVRSYPSSEKTIQDYLQEMKEITLNVYENQDYPYDELVKRLKLQPNVEENPLFNVVFSMLNYEDYSVRINDLSFEYFENPIKKEIYDIRVEIVESPEGFQGVFKYSAELYKKETIQTLLNDYTKVLEIISNDIEIKLKDIELIQAEPNEEIEEFEDVRFQF